jgi:hypothetical protein
MTPPIDPSDPTAPQWLADVCAQVADLGAAALDQVADPQDRDLGPRAAYAAITQAIEKLQKLLAVDLSGGAS